MSSKSNKNQMDNDYNWCNYLVASVDVLGQKEAFRDLEVIPSIDEAKERFKKGHKETVVFLEAFRKGFGEYFDDYSEDSVSIIKVPEEKKSKYDEIRKSITIKYQFFSDSMLAAIPLQTEKYHSHAINSIYGILGACGGMLLFCLADKKAFRAGVDIGTATQLRDGDIYGPALARAYRLESEVAEYPRIVIGNEFKNYLLNLSHKTEQFPGQDEDDKENCKNMADLCLKMMITDIDGVLILDYLGEEFWHRIFRKVEGSRDFFYKAYDFAKNEYEKKRAAGETKLALRYYQLYRYLVKHHNVVMKTMYKSKHLIEERIKQLKYVYFKRIKKHEGKVLIYGGMDKESGCYPLDIDFGNFLTIGRNVFQYALKEIGNNSDLKRLYDSYISGRSILRCFKELRDNDVHVGPGGHRTTIELESRIDIGGKQESATKNNSRDYERKPPVITYEISSILEPTNEVYSKAQKEGNLEIAEAIKNGIPIYVKTECEGECDLFRLCEKYIEEIELFLRYGNEKGFIT